MPQSARLSAGGGGQSLNGQCPNAFCAIFGGASLIDQAKIGAETNIERQILSLLVSEKKSNYKNGNFSERKRAIRFLVLFQMLNFFNKTSPQAKRHQPSLLFASLTITSLTFIT